jgi:hypothetical protein
MPVCPGLCFRSDWRQTCVLDHGANRDRADLCRLDPIGIGLQLAPAARYLNVGPPIVAYWLSRPIAAETVRANIVLYFAISTVITTTVYLAGGLLTLIGCRLGIGHRSHLWGWALRRRSHVRARERNHLPADLLCIDRRRNRVKPASARQFHALSAAGK